MINDFLFLFSFSLVFFFLASFAYPSSERLVPPKPKDLPATTGPPTTGPPTTGPPTTGPAATTGPPTTGPGNNHIPHNATTMNLPPVGTTSQSINMDVAPPTHVVQQSHSTIPVQQNTVSHPPHHHAHPLPNGLPPTLLPLPVAPSVPLPLELEGRDFMLENEYHPPLIVDVQPQYYLDSQWYQGGGGGAGDFLNPSEPYYDSSIQHEEVTPTAPPMPLQQQQEYYRNYPANPPFVATAGQMENYPVNNGSQNLPPEHYHHQGYHQPQDGYYGPHHQTPPSQPNPRTTNGPIPEPPNYNTSLALPSHPPAQPPLPPPVSMPDTSSGNGVVMNVHNVEQIEAAGTNRQLINGNGQLNDTSQVNDASRQVNDASRQVNDASRQVNTMGGGIGGDDSKVGGGSPTVVGQGKDEKSFSDEKKSKEEVGTTPEEVRTLNQ